MINFKDLRAQIALCEDLIRVAGTAVTEMETQSLATLESRYAQDIQPVLREMTDIACDLLADGVLSYDAPSLVVSTKYGKLNRIGFWNKEFRYEYLNGDRILPTGGFPLHPGAKLFPCGKVLSRAEQARAEFVRHWDAIEPILVATFEQWCRSVLDAKADRVTRRYDRAAATA